MSSQKPKYEQLAIWIKTKIEKGEFSQGDKFYSENELSELSGYSRQTVRRAIADLTHEGYLDQRRGSGTFVIYDPLQRQNKTKTIGVISTYVDNYIFPSIIQGIEKVLTQNGYSMNLMFTGNRVENEQRALQVMIDNNVDGIIAEPTQSGLPNPNVGVYTEIMHRQIPMIFFNASYPNLTVPYIGLDDRAVGAVVTNEFLSMGHTKISGFFKLDDRQGHLRYEGYQAALLDAGISLDARRILWYSTEDLPTMFEDSERLTDRLMDSTALFCYNDQIAIKMLEFFSNKGIKIPQDISIIGVDNAEASDYTTPPITTVNHPKELLGTMAAEHILKLLEDPSFEAQYKFEPKIIRRESVRKNSSNS